MIRLPPRSTQSRSSAASYVYKRKGLLDKKRAMELLRSAGFKIVLHWMPNLLGATPDSDRHDYDVLWSDKSLQPDEIKIYPCSLLSNA